jgi:sulfur carrier protein
MTNLSHSHSHSQSKSSEQNLKIYLNNEEHIINVDAPLTIENFLHHHLPQNFSLPHQSPYALALNGEFVPKSLYSATILKPKDKMEILSPFQGG